MCFGRVRHRPSQSPTWRLFAEKVLEQFFFCPAPHRESNGVDPEGDGVDPEDDHTDGWIAALSAMDLTCWQDLIAIGRIRKTCIVVVWSASAFNPFRSTQPAFEIRDKWSERGRSLAVNHSMDNYKCMVMVACGSAHKFHKEHLRTASRANQLRYGSS